LEARVTQKEENEEGGRWYENAKVIGICRYVFLFLVWRECGTARLKIYISV
jgi:hypothetical protein